MYDMQHDSGKNAAGAPARRAADEANRISRRRFFGGAATVGALAVGGGALALKVRSEGEEGTVRVANWPYYIDLPDPIEDRNAKATVNDFRKATGITVDYQEVVEDNDEFLAGVQRGLEAGRPIGWDIVVLTDWMAAKWIFNQWATRFDIGMVPNRVNLRAELASPSYDPSRLYTLPWASGMTGIAYDSAALKEVKSLNQLFDSKYKGKIGILSEMRDTLGLFLLAQGFSPEGVTMAQAKAAIEKIGRARVDLNLKVYDADYGDALKSGEIIAAFGWAGDVEVLKADSPSLRWVVPEEGAMIYTDSMLIPKNAENVAGAHRFMNYVYNSKNAAQIVLAAPYMSPVQGAYEEVVKVKPEMASSIALNPSAEDRRKLHTFRTMSDSMTDELNGLFNLAIGRDS